MTDLAMCPDDEMDLLDTVPGLINRRACERLYRLAMQVPHEEAIVNIGVYKGRSACFLGAGGRAGKGAQVFAVDAWDLPGNESGKHRYDDPSLLDTASRHVSMMGLEEYVMLYRGFSEPASFLWEEKGSHPIGLLFIDGGHRFKEVVRDYFSWNRFLSPTAVVVFDDYDTPKNPGVKEVVDKLVRMAKGELCLDVTVPPLAVLSSCGIE